jgi:hypothetical protein
MGNEIKLWKKMKRRIVNSNGENQTKNTKKGCLEYDEQEDHKLERGK